MQNNAFMQVWQTVLHAAPEIAQPILEAFLPTGLADIVQVAQATNLTRDRANRALEHMVSAKLIAQYPALQRPDQRGKPSAFYLLTTDGAEVLQGLGHHKATACNLNGETQMLHGLAMTDMHIAAHKAGIEIATDRELDFNSRNLRPDHLVTLSDRNKLIFEVEQVAGKDSLRRVVKSLQNKQDFFSSKTHPDILPEVRMILQVQRGAKWDKTINTWVTALGVVAERSGGNLAFRLFVIPRREFLDAPDWEETRKLLWREITPMQQRVQPMEIQAVQTSQLMYGSQRENHVVLMAVYQELIENLKTSELYPVANAEFFEIMRLIYSGSYNDGLSPLEQAVLPHASIYLLGTYLKMRELVVHLNKTMHSGKGSMRWNPTTIMHRMQSVVHTFLWHHGWRSDGALYVYTTVSDWQSHSIHQFQVRVQIRSAEIMMADGDLVVPTRDEVKRTEEALAWVLQALFVYGPELGLGKVEFW
jgi:hypothetical protein